MPQVTHISSGVTVSVPARRAATLDGTVWRAVDDAPAKPKPKRNRNTKPKAEAPEAPTE